MDSQAVCPWLRRPQAEPGLHATCQRHRATAAASWRSPVFGSLEFWLWGMVWIGLGTHHRSLRTFCTGKNTKMNSSNGWIVDMWHVMSESRCQWGSKPLKCRRIIICIHPKPSVFVVSEPYLGLIQTFQPMLIIFASHRLNILDQFWHLMTCMAFGMALWPCAFGGMDEHLKKLCKFRRDRSGCNRCCC